jgi:hypothetical protein
LPSFAHKKIIEEIVRLDAIPSDPAVFREWIKAGRHLDFLEKNAISSEIVIYASAEYTFVHSMIVPNDVLALPDQKDLLEWNGNPYTSIASYVYGGGREQMWIERGEHNSGSKALDTGRDLVFARTFEGWSADDNTYLELHQEYSHLANIHWRPEHGAYCKFDANGDLQHNVSMTVRGQNGAGLNLASFLWETLEEYLAISDCSLVRMFDFSLLRHADFTSWGDGPEIVHSISPDFFYRQKIAGNAAYTKGVQIVRTRRAAADIMNDVKDGWSGRKNKKYATFTANDIRNGVVAQVSTDPSATTNYFEAAENSLPFELSPAFFRPEVLLKYKTDREKYTVGERSVDCRAAWHLRGYDVNEAGQVHVYICDLRALPYAEQLHWLSFNEEAKTGISERAFVNDFKGEFVSFEQPLQQVLSVLRRWKSADVDWWKLRAENVLDSISAPISPSQDEWSEAFMDLSKLIAEGFDLKAIRARLSTAGVAYPEKEQSIALLERHLGRGHASGVVQLPGLRTIQWIRSKAKGHAGSSEAKKIVQEAIATHGSLPEHFKHVCNIVAAELGAIERDLNPSSDVSTA